MPQVIPSSRLFPSPTGLKATYYDNADFTGRAIERTDSTIDFNWSLASPDPEIGADTFSARWSGQLVPQHTQTYRFFLSTDADAVARLRIDGMVIVDNTSVQDLGEIALEAGKRYDLLLEYSETAGPANVKLEWSSPSQAKQVVPSSRLVAADATAIPLRRAD